MSHCDCDDCKSRTPPAAPSDEDVRAMVARLRKLDNTLGRQSVADTIESLLAANARLKADSVRLDWLEHQYVVVRKPLRYGSAPLFDACPDEDDNPSSLRAARFRAAR